MLEALSSKVILTKVKAMVGRMLTDADYEQLLHKNSVPACAAYLKAQPGYAGVLRDVQETQIHRGSLEALLNKAMFEQYVRLAHYAGKSNPFFHRYYAAQLEIRSILSCIRLFGSENPNEYVQSVPGYVLDFLSFDALSLGAVHSYPALVEALRKTPYHKVLEPLRLTGSDQRDLPRVEHALFAYFFHMCFRLIDANYKGKTANELKTLFATQAQLFNIRAVYRLKRFFGGKPEDVRAILLDYRGRLPERVFEELVAAPNADRVLEILAASRYNRYFDKDHFVYIEYSAGAIRYNLAKRYLTFSQNPATAFVSFLLLREIEIDNLMAIIEGVRYKLEISQIRPLLIRSGA